MSSNTAISDQPYGPFQAKYWLIENFDIPRKGNVYLDEDDNCFQTALDFLDEPGRARRILRPAKSYSGGPTGLLVESNLVREPEDGDWIERIGTIATPTGEAFQYREGISSLSGPKERIILVPVEPTVGDEGSISAKEARLIMGWHRDGRIEDRGELAGGGELIRKIHGIAQTDRTPEPASSEREGSPNLEADQRAGADALAKADRMFTATKRYVDTARDDRTQSLLDAVLNSLGEYFESRQGKPVDATSVESIAWRDRAEELAREWEAGDLNEADPSDFAQALRTRLLSDGAPVGIINLETGVGPGVTGSVSIRVEVSAGFGADELAGRWSADDRALLLEGDPYLRHAIAEEAIRRALRNAKPEDVEVLDRTVSVVEAETSTTGSQDG